MRDADETLIHPRIGARRLATAEARLDTAIQAGTGELRSALMVLEVAAQGSELAFVEAFARAMRREVEELAASGDRSVDAVARLNHMRDAFDALFACLKSYAAASGLSVAAPKT